MAKKAIQTMDLSQASQMIQWLDEERRKDKAVIAALQEQVRTQEELLSQQSTRVQDLQTKTTSLQTLISQVTDFEQTVVAYKNEMVFLVDQREEARKKETTETERLRKIEFEAISTHLGRLDKHMQVLPRYDEELTARRAEDQRLVEALQRLEMSVKGLDKRSDDRVQAVTYLEEQRRSDNRRIAELEHDVTDLRKRVDAQVVKLPLLEETIRKQKTRVEEAVQTMKAFEKPIEELRISDFQREQKVKQYMDQGAQVAQEMDRLRQQTQGFVEQQQQVKRAVEKVGSFQARIEKRQNEVAEMQRLAEDRVKRQWEEWQAVRIKAQKKQDILVEERWNQQDQVNAEHGGRLDKLLASTALHHTQLAALWEGRRTDAVRALKAVQDEHQTVLSQADEQLSILRNKTQ